MAKITGFMEFKQMPITHCVRERVNDSKKFISMFTAKELNEQAVRCMDCGIWFCQSSCSLGNIVPEFNDAIYQGNIKKAYQTSIPHVFASGDIRRGESLVVSTLQEGRDCAKSIPQFLLNP